MTKDLIKKYYDAFNKNDMQTFLSLLSDDVIHDINQGKQEVGKEEFRRFMDHMNRCYKETIRDLVIMTSDDDKHAAAKFIVDGTYLETDKGLPDANNQTYTLPAGAFFEIENGKIKRITMSYNLRDWLEQVS